MARMAGARSAADASTEIVRLSADLERSPPDPVSPPGEQADFEPTELPSFRRLPDAQRWPKTIAQAPPDKKADEEATVLEEPATDARQVSWTGRQAQRRIAAEATSERNEIKEEIALARSGHAFRLRRLIMLACVLALGISVGFGVRYLTQIPDVAGESYVQHLRAAISSVAATLGAGTAPASGGINDGHSPRGVVVGSNSHTGGVDVLKASRTNAAAMGAKLSDGAAGGPLKSSDPHPRSDGQVLPGGAENRDGIDAGNAGLALLVEQAERQIADRQLEQPPGNNALETYHRIVALSPQDPATTHVGERLSTTFWSLAMDAKAAEHWDDAVHYLDILDTLPPVPAGAILARSAAASAGSAPDGHNETAEQAKPAEAGAIGRFEDVPTVPASDATPEKGGLPERLHAMATPSSTKDVSQATGSLALNRGDAAMRSGDVVAARRFYQISASADIAGAARAVARTYDPTYLQQIGVRGLQSDAEAAKRWYEKAIEEGDTEARTSLNQLLNSVEKARR